MQASRLMFFVDPTTMAGEAAILYAREFHRRYKNNHLEMLLVLRPAFGYFFDPKCIENLIRKEEITFPVVIDAEELLFAAFDVKRGPKIILLHEGKKSVELSGIENFKAAELQLQNFLRNQDPGLPLFRPFEPSVPTLNDVSKIDFGRTGSAKFPSPGFNFPAASAFGTAAFNLPPPKKLKEGEFFIQGTWMQDPDRIATSDSESLIQIHLPSPGLVLVAQTLSKTHELVKVIVEVGGVPAYQDISGDDLHLDDEGHSVVKIDGPRLYFTLKGLPSHERDVTLRFTHAERVPVAIYGIRFTS